MFRLIVYQPDGVHKELELETRAYTLGRDEKNDIVLSDDAVSREHAHISFENDGFVIKDLKSAGGVYLNGKKIEGKQPIKGGDTVLIGMTKIEVVAKQDEKENEESGNYDGDKTRMLQPEDLEKILKTDDAPKLSFKEEGSDLTREKGQGEAGKTSLLDPAEIVVPGAKQKQEQDKTTHIDPNALDEHPIANYHKLIVSSKESFGKEYLLDQMETIIGRAQDCAISINHETVSSQHALIRIEGDTCIVKDLNSKNGTIVNGARIAKDHILHKGDEIEIKPLKFTFLDKDAAISKDELLSTVEKQQGRKKSNKVLIGVVAAFCIIVAFLALQKNSEVPDEKVPQKGETIPGGEEPLVPTQKTSQTGKGSPVQNLVKKSSSDIYFTTGNEFLEKRFWEEAIDKYEKVLDIDPEYPDVSDRINTADFELKNRNLMEEGLLLIGANKYEDGIAQLEDISQESTYFNEVMLEIQFARDAMERAKAQRESAKPKKVAKPKESPVYNEQKGRELIDQALKYYAEGNVNISISKLNAVMGLPLSSNHMLKSKASTLKNKIKTIQQTYEKGLSEYNNKQLGEAFQTWSQVLELDQQIIGQKKSHFSNKIAIYMAEKFYQTAQEAYNNGNYAQAYKNCLKTLKAKPGHKACLEIEASLSEKAKKLYEEGYILEDLNPTLALEKCKQVLEICPPGNPYYEKAKSLIAKYE